jgi:hypothetical protein
MNPYNKRTLLGVAAIHYHQNGEPSDAAFVPAVFRVDTAKLAQLLSFPAATPHEVLTTSQTLLSAWVMEVGNVETADRELNRVEGEIRKCETWPDGKPKYCQVAFYFVTTTDEPLRVEKKG